MACSQPVIQGCAPELELLPMIKDGDRIGFLQKYGAGIYSGGWKRQFVALMKDGTILNSYDLARDYNRRPAASFFIEKCDDLSTYEDDTTPKKPPAFNGAPANGFVIRILGKPTYFFADTEDEAKSWIQILDENRVKHYKDKLAPLRRQSRKYKGQNEVGRDLCRVKGEDGRLRGFLKDILIENLTERDNAFLVCLRCQGIMREACLSSDGKQFCSCCKEEDEQTHPNAQVNLMVASLKCSCPLLERGCDWLGTLGSVENHLDTCGYVLETCKLGCGVVLQRDKHDSHEGDECVQRIVKCEHCKRDFKFHKMAKHLKLCPKMKVSCQLNCGTVLRRENLKGHLAFECRKVVEECNLGCGMKLTREELKVHVLETCVQRIVNCEHCKKEFKFCDLAKHLEMCPKVQVSCELCGVVMCRDNVTQHLEFDCGEKEIKCPFAKYKCELLIKRKDLSKHLEEKRMEHTEKKLNAMEEIIAKQNEKISKLATLEDIVIKQKEEILGLNQNIHRQDEMIEEMSQSIKSLKTDMKQFTQEVRTVQDIMVHRQTQILNSIPIKLEWRNIEANLYGHPIQKEFEAAEYQLLFELTRSTPDKSTIQMIFHPRSGDNYDKLRWPFRAEFLTRSLIAESVAHPLTQYRITKEFRSEVIEVKRENFNSESSVNFTIATMITSEVTTRSIFCGRFNANFEIIINFC